MIPKTGASKTTRINLNNLESANCKVARYFNKSIAYQVNSFTWLWNVPNAGLVSTNRLIVGLNKIKYGY